MADDGWQSRSHADIVGKLGALKADNAFTLANTWSDVYTKLSDAAVSYGNAKSNWQSLISGRARGQRLRSMR